MRCWCSSHGYFLQGHWHRSRPSVGYVFLDQLLFSSHGTTGSQFVVGGDDHFRFTLQSSFARYVYRQTVRGCTHSHRQVMVSLYLSFHPFFRPWNFLHPYLSSYSSQITSISNSINSGRGLCIQFRSIQSIFIECHWQLRFPLETYITNNISYSG